MLVQVKRNQPTLYAQLQQHAIEHTPSDSAVTQDHGRRNRSERRQACVWYLPETLLEAGWAPLRTLIRMERGVAYFDPSSQTWQSRQETSWYVCTRPLCAGDANRLVRGHWGIENRCHHVRDVTFGEDASRTRVNPGVFAQLRTWALNCLRHAGHRNIKAAREQCGWDTDRLLALFTCS